MRGARRILSRPSSDRRPYFLPRRPYFLRLRRQQDETNWPPCCSTCRWGPARGGS